MLSGKRTFGTKSGGLVKQVIMHILHFRKEKMNFLYLLLIVSIILTFTSCKFLRKDTIMKDDEETIVKETVDKMITALELQDKDSFVDLFSKNARESVLFHQKVNEFFILVSSDNISFDSSPGVASESDYEKGKKRTYVYDSFLIETKEKKYYLAICMCTSDTFDNANVGIKSVYIIDAGQWKEDYEYGGDGMWQIGIHIEN